MGVGVVVVLVVAAVLDMRVRRSGSAAEEAKC